MSEVPPEQARAEGADAIDFEDLFETAPCGYLSTDKHGRIMRANQTFAAWLGLAPAALVGQRFSDLLPIADKIFYETHVAPMLHMHGSMSEIALDVVAINNRRIPMLVNAIERKDNAGRPSFIRLTLFVAAERRAYERGLLAERDLAKANVEAARAEAELREQFIAVLGHDLRNPLASISSGVRILQKETLSDRGRVVLGLMNGSLIRAADLIDNVLDFARGRLGGGIALTRSRDEPLEPVLRLVVAELCSIAPDQVVDACFALQEPIDCDHVRIGQLISNLLGNAMTHGAKDRTVRVEATTTPDELVISVTNGGTPIPPEALSRLFQPFYRGDSQVRHQGLGLGLHIASEIARAHGGQLAVRSDEEGTCFTFTMPLALPGGAAI